MAHSFHHKDSHLCTELVTEDLAELVELRFFMVQVPHELLMLYIVVSLCLESIYLDAELFAFLGRQLLFNIG